MGSIYDKLLQVVSDDLELKHQAIPERGVIRFGYSGRNANVTCTIRAREEQDQYIIHAACPIKVQPDMRPDALVLVNKINVSMISGALFMDPRDGEILYRVGVNVDPERGVSAAVAAHSIRMSVIVIDRHVGDVMRLMHAPVAVEDDESDDVLTFPEADDSAKEAAND